MNRFARSFGLASAFIAAGLLAVMPVAGHALSICVCADGEVSLEAECLPETCCDDTHSSERAGEPADAPESSECTELPLLPDTDLQISTSTVAPRLPVTAMAALTPQETSVTPTPEERPQLRRPLRIPLANQWEALRSTVILV